MRKIKKREKKGISIMIGYVLLISVGLIMGLIAYQWLKSYVPKDTVKCPDGVSVILGSATCDGVLYLKDLKNNGLFNIDGYYIRATTSVDEDVATQDLYIDAARGENIYSENMIPGGLVSLTSFGFNQDVCDQISGCSTSYTIYSIEIIPVRLQQSSGEVYNTATCGDAKIKQELDGGCKIISGAVAAKPVIGVDGECRTTSSSPALNVQNLGTTTPSSIDVCIEGAVSSFVPTPSTNPTSWTWNCIGTGNGATVPCSATKTTTPKANGATCTLGTECTSGKCYIDNDNDRYAPASGTKTCEASSQLTGVDCDDNNVAIWTGCSASISCTGANGTDPYDDCGACKVCNGGKCTNIAAGSHDKDNVYGCGSTGGFCNGNGGCVPSTNYTCASPNSCKSSCLPSENQLSSYTCATGSICCSSSTLKANGATCNLGTECTSGQCYIDNDNDRYAPASGTKTCEANSQLTGVDCDDNNVAIWTGCASIYTYAWYSGSWGACSKTCGGGTSIRSVFCMRSDGVTSADSYCTGTKPTASQSCNTQTCLTYSWEMGSWGSCSLSCGTGTQSRSVVCKASDGSTALDSYCNSAAKPATIQYCNTQTCITYSWVAGTWGSCSKTCGGGTQSRSVYCMRSDGIISADSYCTGTKPAVVQGCNTQNCPVACSWVNIATVPGCWVNIAPYPLSEYGPECTLASVGWEGYYIFPTRSGTTKIWTAAICTSAQIGQTIYKFRCTCLV